MGRSAPYTHQPLQEAREQIRLVMIERARFNEPLTVHLQIFDINNAPKYSALSYTWGPAKPSYLITVDGRWLDIRKNLFHFLREFRQEPGRPEWLWIDQISIDQTNVKERNHQVRFMSRIYSQCYSVTVWLNDDNARDFVSFQDPAALAQLLRNEYFSRLWIVQEVLLAQHVRFLTPGNLWISWDAIQDTVGRTANSFFAKLDLNPSSAMSLLALNVERLPSSLEWCILEFSGNKCEDPRDKVYGFMGLVDPCYNFDIDYSRSKVDVYRDAVYYSRNRSEVAQVLGKNMGIEAMEIDKFLGHVEHVEFPLTLSNPSLREGSISKTKGVYGPRRSVVLEPLPRTTGVLSLNSKVNDVVQSIAPITRSDSLLTQQEKARRKFVHRKGAVSIGDGSLHGSLASLAHKTWTKLSLNKIPAINAG
ncbi:uncharacterized protein M421DRAFT_93744 [Didymella exigua CBS 183.55]|uniref:Heterokaryon incompatibility domain-containing protein n=1 Tax=Didymella exigua CBS 183.55 TaxID=1150837 RepID=A0A6A5RID5_9PLEO|nr:uncharacterized protein M421DRAFT_93744 [Didymella exigua CBS 183.55]KAF1926848.1 hypothetical protein M421DRAFT_93744 [Didymella exigua CBS 183.55]